MSNVMERKSLEQMAEEAGRDTWACPRCGCKDLRCETTWDSKKGRMRRYICRHCGKGLIRTRELRIHES